MLGSVVLDVAIGMAFVYLLLSLIASVVQELLSTFMQLRAANLERALRSLFSGDSIGEGMDLVERIYDHGLVRGLYRDPARDLKGANAVTYQTDRLRFFLRRKIGIMVEKPIDPAVVSNPLLLPNYIPTSVFSQALIDVLNKENLSGSDAMESITRTFRDHHWNFADNKATQALYALALRADGKLSRYQQELEDWYNSAMDRASGWYKRYTQRVLLVIGLVLACVFNVNSIRVGSTLWSDREIRQGMVDAASEYSNAHPQEPGGGSVAQGQFDPAKMKDRLDQTVTNFRQVADSHMLPLGWSQYRSAREHWQDFRADFPGASKHALSLLVSGRFWELIFGWCVTAAAISLGAPFWFDTLNRFMVVRGTVKPTEKSKPEESKD